MPAHLRWSLHCSEHEPGHRTCRGVSASRHCEGAWLDMVVPAESWDESELCWAAFLTAGQMGGFLDERITSQNCKWPTIKMKSDTFLSKSILCLALRMMQEAIIHKIKLLQMCFSQRTGDLPPVISSCCSDYTNSGWLFHPLWGAQQLVWLQCEVLVGLLENFFLASWLTATSFCLSYWLFWSEICLSPVCKEIEKGSKS